MKPGPQLGSRWPCPRCRRTFRHRNQWHSCAPVTSIESHFEGRPRVVRDLALALIAAVRKTRIPHEVVPVKTRILLRGERVFVVLIPLRDRLEGELLLPGPASHPCFGRVVPYVRGTLVHRFRLAARRDLDSPFRRWLREAALLGAAPRAG